MRQIICLFLLLVVSSSISFSQPPSEQAGNGEREQMSEQADSATGLNLQSVEEKLEGDFGAKEITAANSWAQSLQLADWLGPLAPVALSPFFGMACLSGLSLYGPDWVTNNALLGSSGPLQNPWLFTAFIVLTLLTSLPRLSKVSKPFAQAMDQLETYSVIIILLAIKVLSDFGTSGDETTPIAMVQLGVFSVAADTLLMIAMTINIVVVNTVKFFFEFLVWLTPIPALDAIFEVCNKAICAGLMAVYAFSPAIATIINLVILLSALVVFRWVSRQVRYYRTMVMDPLITRCLNKYGAAADGSIVVFPSANCGPFAAKSRLRLKRSGDGWDLQEANWWMPSRKHLLSSTTTQPTLRRGWVMHTITFTDGETQQIFKISRRYDATLPQIAPQLGIEIPNAETAATQDAKVEFA